MGILRTDRVAGLGGANAITGSVDFFTGRNKPIFLKIASDDFAVGTGDFTVEAWYYRGGLGTHDDAVGNIIVETGNQNGQNGIWLADAQGKLEGRVHYGSGSWNLDITSSSTMVSNRWYHVAMSRSGSTVRIFLDGALEASGSSSSDLTTDYSNEAYIGGQGNSTGNRGIIGFISNARISNTALYTAAFTVPTTMLEKLSSTLLLCCQSPGNVLQEETGKTVETFVDNTNNRGPVASRFTPNSPVGFSTTSDVGTQFGSTFDGVTTFDSQAYMVVPGGNTRERNRGRALFGGGSTIDNTIQFLNIQSQGNAEDFGDLSTGRYETECASSSTRGIWGGGYTESPNVKVDVIEFVTIASSSNATDFGNLTVARGHLAGMCNSTRGVFANGSTDPGPNVNTLDFITIATAGNATDFGDSTTASKPMGGGRSSTTRGIFTLGNAPSAVNNIEYITIASTGDSQDFGDLTNFSGWGKGAGNISSGTRAILVGGHEALNNIEYITIASLGNGTDFGDLIVGRRSAFTAGSKTRGVFGGGKNPSQLNTIEYVEIATTGNALDFGDMINSKSFSSGLSDCHGGLE